MSGAKRDYEIGKGKPPKATRFKPGRSGNPGGRPKGRRNLAPEIEEVLTAPVPITENGRSRQMTSRMATLMKLRMKALAGDGRAMDRFLELALSHAAEQQAHAEDRRLSGSEEDILARYIESRLRQGDGEPAKRFAETEEDNEQSR